MQVLSAPATIALGMTLEEFEQLPEGPPHFELIESILTYMPAPEPIHERVSQNINVFLCVFVRKHHLGEVMTAPVDVVLSDVNLFQPDIFFISKLRADIVKRMVYGAPDLVVEILSPSTARRDVDYKMPRYAQAGVREFWLVSIESMSLTRFDNRDGIWVEGGVLTARYPTLQSLVVTGYLLRHSEVFDRIMPTVSEPQSLL
jgi:Uma2 family endonuclease